jgi:hypothetical protein
MPAKKIINAVFASDFKNLSQFIQKLYQNTMHKNRLELKAHDRLLAKLL